jgi:hypothetical protein
MSGAEPDAGANFWPRNVWQQRNPEAIAEMAIHASGRSWMDS